MARILKKTASLCLLNHLNRLLSSICLALKHQPEMQATSSFTWRSGNEEIRPSSSVSVIRSSRLFSWTQVRSSSLLQVAWLHLLMPSERECLILSALILKTRILLSSRDYAMLRICWSKWSILLSRTAQNSPRVRALRLHQLVSRDSGHMGAQEGWWRLSQVQFQAWVLVWLDQIQRRALSLWALGSY